MAVKHVVLFKFKEHVDAQLLQQLIDGFKALPAQIDVMKGFEWGTDISPENLQDGFTHCFITTFDDAAGRDAYLPHPAHKAYVEFLLPNLEKALVVDFISQGAA